MTAQTLIVLFCATAAAAYLLRPVLRRWRAAGTPSPTASDKAGAAGTACGGCKGCASSSSGCH